ncbi:SgcJ/EcaC family oxidoreductase [Hydrogenophaga sp.]|uniref:SgcJ/EcaC family oxidoreductase n=1 Tax=Hydrogenophaga sp. TaxID=1904254 RepID=UPI00273066B8|nr:SgcJ/EcaC family oxidoreductase [Hydrogenophaga sp.]MDP2015845.1 SgcJ/EcaC family oxidoreductase [Hydrogenophaga sp.]MDP3167148.1 SgcJ/EcaC family oxidoreductase [Hydrogenophaga sp.]
MGSSEAPAEEASVQAATEAWIAAFNRCDAAAIAALYDPQAVLWGTTAPQLITTPQGIAAYFDAVFALRPAPRMALVDALPRVFGDVAVSTGRYTLALAQPPQLRQVPARFSFTYRRTAGAWRIVDHHSSAVPVPLTALTALAAAS